MVDLTLSFIQIDNILNIIVPLSREARLNTVVEYN